MSKLKFLFLGLCMIVALVGCPSPVDPVAPDADPPALGTTDNAAVIKKIAGKVAVGKPATFSSDYTFHYDGSLTVLYGGRSPVEYKLVGSSLVDKRVVYENLSTSTTMNRMAQFASKYWGFEFKSADFLEFEGFYSDSSDIDWSATPDFTDGKYDETKVTAKTTLETTFITAVKSKIFSSGNTTALGFNYDFSGDTLAKDFKIGSRITKNLYINQAATTFFVLKKVIDGTTAIFHSPEGRGDAYDFKVTHFTMDGEKIVNQKLKADGTNDGTAADWALSTLDTSKATTNKLFVDTIYATTTYATVSSQENHSISWSAGYTLTIKDGSKQPGDDNADVVGVYNLFTVTDALNATIWENGTTPSNQGSIALTKTGESVTGGTLTVGETVYVFTFAAKPAASVSTYGHGM